MHISSHRGCVIPICAGIPNVRWHSVQAVSNFDLFTLDDVDTSFANSVQLKYQQHYQLQGTLIVFIVLVLTSLFKSDGCAFSHTLRYKK